MEYTRAAREVVDAVKSVREADDGIWWDRAMVAIAELFPTSSFAFALYQPEVWSRDGRRRLRAEPAPVNRAGFFLEDWIAGAEAAAASEGARLVQELHLARATAESSKALADLGIATEALVARTAERETTPLSPAGPMRPRVVGLARMEILNEVLSGSDMQFLLTQDQRTGTVVRIRSILNTERDILADQERAAVALVNGSPDTPVYLIFGQDDDYTVVGEVDTKLVPLQAGVVKASQIRLDQRLENCTPPVLVKWRDISQDGKRVWVAGMLGRARGVPVRMSTGAYPYRSGETTQQASPELITAWLREPANSDSGVGAIQETGDDLGPAEQVAARPQLPEEGREQRLALAALQEAVASFFESPPTIPDSVRGRTLAEWGPVVDPILTHFREAIEAAVTSGIKADDPALERLMRGVRSTFRLPNPRSGSTWIVEAPRLIARLIADRLLEDSYCTDRWMRILRVGNPGFDSYIGRVPWVLAPEYRHPETLGRNADVANELSLREIGHSASYLRDLGVGQTALEASFAAISLGLALGTMAREEASSGREGQAAWVMLRGIWSEFERWEEDEEIVDTFATLAGERPNVFRGQLPRRIQAIVKAYRSIGSFLDIPSGSWASIERIAKQGSA